jgi:hypothetical protein
VIFTKGFLTFASLTMASGPFAPAIYFLAD